MVLEQDCTKNTFKLIGLEESYLTSEEDNIIFWVIRLLINIKRNIMDFWILTSIPMRSM